MRASNEVVQQGPPGGGIETYNTCETYTCVNIVAKIPKLRVACRRQKIIRRLSDRPAKPIPTPLIVYHERFHVVIHVDYAFPSLCLISPRTWQVATMKAAKDAVGTVGMEADPFVFAT